jgi:hypothetical protein
MASNSFAVIPRSLLRPLLRWSSLVLILAVLARIGAARLHLHNFSLFLAVVVGLALLTVAVFVATTAGDAEE